MVLKILTWFFLARPVRRICNEDGDLYLLRIKLWGWMPGDKRKHLCSGYLHRFIRPDLDRALHNHPWRWAFSLVIYGGYEEERLVRGRIITRRLRPGRLNFLGPGSFHRITELHGEQTWSLFIAGPKFKTWGFLDKARGFIPWRERFQERGIPVPDGVSV